MPRSSAYAAFNYIVSFDTGGDPGGELGGFSDVSGLNASTDFSAYRDGGQKPKPVRKAPGRGKTADLVLKRGVVDARQFSAWLEAVRIRGGQARRALTIILRDEKGRLTQRWKVTGVIPQKYTGPTLAAKGGGDVAMEELVLSSEGIELK